MWSPLHEEFKSRYGKQHLSYTKLKDVLQHSPTNIDNTPFTQPTQAMPDDVKDDDSIVAYRNYYIKYKKHFAVWKNRKQPDWFTVGMVA